MVSYRSEFYESVDGGTGSEVNGSWDGMVGMIMRGEVMVGASSFLLTSKRLGVVDYTLTVADTAYVSKDISINSFSITLFLHIN